MIEIPANLRELFEEKITCALATIMPNGQPQVTPVWVDLEDGYVCVNTAEGRQKARNLKVGSKLTVLLIHPQNDHYWIEVRGHVEQILGEKEGGRDHINRLSRKYTGKEYGGPADQIRLKYKIAPDKINSEDRR